MAADAPYTWLKLKYRTQRTVKQNKSTATTGVSRKTHTVKQPTQPARPMMLVVDGGTGRRRWVRD
jgi:hypothetical protein